MKKIVAITFLVLSFVCLFASSAEMKRTLNPLFAVADLSVTKVDTPDPVNTGANLTYTVTVTNNGPDAAANASWSDPLPPGTTFVSLTGDVSGWTCTAPEVGDVGTVSCSNPSFAVGSSVFTLTLAVAPTVLAGSTLSNTATATSSSTEGSPGNESGTAITTVRSPAIVSGSKFRSGGTSPGSTVEYLIILSNTSASDQQDNPGNEFTDVLPAGLTLVSAAASSGTATATVATNTVTWNGVVPAIDSLTITISATINSGTEDQTIANQGSISYDADGNGTNEANASTNSDNFVVGASAVSADLGVTKSVSADTSPADSDVTYTISVINGGPDTATSATLTDTLAGNMTFVSLSQPAGWSCNSLTPGLGGTLTCSRDLPVASGVQVFTLVGHIPSGTANDTFYLNVASVTTTATDSTSENNSSSAGTVVGCLTNPVVTTNADSGAGSLRRAIQDACVGGTITFDMTQVTSPITLTSAELLINQDLTIQGPGADLLSIQRSNALGTPAFRIFNVVSATVTISGLTTTNGATIGGATGNNPGENGGGILNTGTLTIKNSTISGNVTGGGGGNSGGTAGVGGNGGGIFNSGTLTITGSTISGNRAGSGGNGGSTGIGGHGGDGGGIGNTGTLTVTNSTVSGNQAGGGGNTGSSGTAGTGGDGGGILSDNAVTITNCTINGNQAGDGGVAGDSGSASGGRGGGLYKGTVAVVNLRNSIIAGNTSTAGPDINATVNSQDYNLIGSTSGATITGTTTHNVTNTSANLGVLATNGGPTQTILPLPGSPAINAGAPANLPPDTFDVDNDSDTAEALPIDQRGSARVVGANFDIGAVETNYTVTATAGTPQSAVINSAFATDLKATVTESGNPQNAVSVTFTAPGSGASGAFPGPSATAVVATNSSGVATAPTFTANGTAGGPYNVVASIGAGLPTATFALTNSKAATSTAVSASPNPSNFGQSVTFTATVTSAAGTPTGTVQFKIDGTNSGAPVTLNGSGVATLSTSTLTAGTHTVAADYNGDTNFAASSGTLSGGQEVNNRPLVSLSQSNYNVNESTGFVTITVNRTGDLAVPVTVDYATDDTGSSNACGTLNSTLASARCDFGLTLGTLKFAATETQKTFVIPITQDSYTEGPEMFTVNLSNLTGTGAAFAIPSSATVTINDSAAPAPNAIDDTEAFVRQQYRDFLNREAEPAGLAFWKDNIDKCNDPMRLPAGLTVAECIEVMRINTSAAFFLSIEFQQSGNLVRSFYVATLNRPATNNMPAFVEFERDTQALQRGVIVGQGSWEQTLNDNRDAFMKEFVTRAEFVGLYPTTDTPTQYVDKLYLHAGVSPGSAQERTDAIAEFGSATTAADPGARGRALLRVTLNVAFQQREFSRSFVQMEYFGYLRRNPNDAPDGSFAGYDFWLGKLNAAGDNYIQAEMVKAFLRSDEYRQRFGP